MSLMTQITAFFMITAIRSQMIPTGKCVLNDNLLPVGEGCSKHFQSGNGTEAKLPDVSAPEMRSNARQIKGRLAPRKHKMHTFQEDHAKLRKMKVRTFQTHTHHVERPPVIERPKIKVAKMEPKPATKAPQMKVKTSVPGGSILLSSGQVTAEEVKNNLIEELKATFRTGADHSRINKWERVIAPLFQSMLKNHHGNLGHAAARYVLHRAFVRQHGWSIKGLEPKNTSESSDALKEWVPEYLLNAIEQLVGTKGITSRELAVLAATFEDLAHKEAIARLRDIYAIKKLSIEKPISKDAAEDVVATYMAVYTADLGHRVEKTVKNVVFLGLGLEEHTQRWLREVKSDVTESKMLLNGPSQELSFKTTSRIVEEVGERYGNFNDFECRTLKEVLLDQESQVKPGMLRLADFYRAGMNQTYWNFNEKADYLRVLGALDESGTEPHVIIPNYINSAANCVPVSNFYTVCCRSECETLMGSLEQELKSPNAKPDSIAKAIEGFPEGSVTAPQQVSRTLLNLLEGIAATNDGVVPLHSRDFAQWMHHAFPRECPVPHDSSQNPQTPDEWLREFGADSAKASKEEITQHLEASIAQEAFTNQVPTPQQVSKPLLVKHHQASALTHLKNVLFLHAENDEEFEEAMPWHPQECEVEEPLPCVENLEELEESMPWESQECEEKVFTQPEVKAERPRKLKLQPGSVGLAGTMMHGPEPQSSKQKLSLQVLLDSSRDVRPKQMDSKADEILWEVYNEPAEAYWEREDHAQQELDKADLAEVPTVPLQPVNADVPPSSSPTVGDALASSVHAFATLILLTFFLTFLVAFQYVSAKSKSRGDKQYSSYSKIHEARQDELLRAAAVGCVLQQWSLGGSSHLRGPSTDMV